MEASLINLGLITNFNNRYTKIYSGKNNTSTNILKIEARKKGISFSEFARQIFDKLVDSYSPEYIESILDDSKDYCPKEIKQDIIQTIKNRDKGVIPPIDQYRDKGIGGKNIVKAFKDGDINSEAAANCYVNSKILVTELENTREISKYISLIKSKRDTKKVNTRVKRLYTNVKQVIGDMIPYHKKPGYVEPEPDPSTVKFNEMIDSGEWEEMEPPTIPGYYKDTLTPYPPYIEFIKTYGPK